MNKKQFLLGFLVGGVTLTACTLLAVPAAGRETRQTVKERTKVWLESLSEVNESLVDLNESIKTATLESTETIKSVVSDLTDAVNEWKREIEPHEKEIKKEIEAIELGIATLEAQIKRHKFTRRENPTE